MRVSIVVKDGVVNVDGESYRGIDLTFIDSNISAIQWYDSFGDIEVCDSFGRIVENRSFSDLSPYQQAIDGWQAAKQLAEAAAEAQRLAKQAELLSLMGEGPQDNPPFDELQPPVA